MKTLCTFVLKNGYEIVVPVTVIRALPARFGRRDFVVCPIDGSGEVAVSAKRIREIPDPDSVTKS